MSHPEAAAMAAQQWKCLMQNQFGQKKSLFSSNITDLVFSALLSAEVT